MEQKRVKIIGMSINEKFGSLKATSLKFDEKNRLTVFKGEVGSGKTTLQRALKLGTQGSETLEDKTLYSDHVDIVTQLLDGDMDIFVGCKSTATGSLEYFLHTTDKDGKKIKNPVIDGVKATPAAYLKSLQTSLTWNLTELTSENPITQRNVLLPIYRPELEEKGIYFEKSHPKYVGGIIDKIEKAKNDRNFADMKRKENGGIADDLQKKGIDFSSRREKKSTVEIQEQIDSIVAKITLAKTNLKQNRENAIIKIKNRGLELVAKLKTENEKILTLNRAEKQKETTYKTALGIYTSSVDKAYELLFPLVQETSEQAFHENWSNFVAENLLEPKEPETKELPTLEFNEKGTCLSKPEDFENPEINQLLLDYKKVAVDYIALNSKPIEEVDTTELEAQKTKLIEKKERFVKYNEEAAAINSLWDWKDKNEAVKDIQKDYFLKLTEIETGVEGLYICPEYDVTPEGDKIAKGNDLYLMYDGTYDPEYFSNPDKEIRKLAAYSDTQKPMICLLIQKHLLSRKAKTLPYLWIDQVPIDNKTKALLDRMAAELDLWLFVNWTGDFEKSLLKDGEMLIENGEIFERDEV